MAASARRQRGLNVAVGLMLAAGLLRTDARPAADVDARWLPGHPHELQDSTWIFVPFDTRFARHDPPAAPDTLETTSINSAVSRPLFVEEQRAVHNRRPTFDDSSDDDDSDAGHEASLLSTVFPAHAEASPSVNTYRYVYAPLPAASFPMAWVGRESRATPSTSSSSLQRRTPPPLWMQQRALIGTRQSEGSVRAPLTETETAPDESRVDKNANDYDYDDGRTNVAGGDNARDRQLLGEAGLSTEVYRVAPNEVHVPLIVHDGQPKKRRRLPLGLKKDTAFRVMQLGNAARFVQPSAPVGGVSVSEPLFDERTPPTGRTGGTAVSPLSTPLAAAVRGRTLESGVGEQTYILSGAADVGLVGLHSAYPSESGELPTWSHAYTMPFLNVNDYFSEPTVDNYDTTLRELVAEKRNAPKLPPERESGGRDFVYAKLNPSGRSAGHSWGRRWPSETFPLADLVTSQRADKSAQGARLYTGDRIYWSTMEQPVNNWVAAASHSAEHSGGPGAGEGGRVAARQPQRAGRVREASRGAIFDLGQAPVISSTQPTSQRRSPAQRATLSSATGWSRSPPLGGGSFPTTSSPADDRSRGVNRPAARRQLKHVSAHGQEENAPLGLEAREPDHRRAAGEDSSSDARPQPSRVARLTDEGTATTAAAARSTAAPPGSDQLSSEARGERAEAVGFDGVEESSGSDPSSSAVGDDPDAAEHVTLSIEELTHDRGLAAHDDDPHPRAVDYEQAGGKSDFEARSIDDRANAVQPSATSPHDVVAGDSHRDAHFTPRPLTEQRPHHTPTTKAAVYTLRLK